MGQLRVKRPQELVHLPFRQDPAQSQRAKSPKLVPPSLLQAALVIHLTLLWGAEGTTVPVL